MTSRTATLTVILCAALCAVFTGLGELSKASAMPLAKPVAITLIDTEPDYLVYVKSDRTVAPKTDEEGRPNVCGNRGYFTETSAYRFNGKALAGQRWNKFHDTTFWRDDHEGGRVSYDGYAIHNSTPRPVIFVAWCD